MRIKRTLKLCVVNILSNKYRFLAGLFFIAVILMFFSHIGENINKILEIDDRVVYKYYGEPIDVVYTWVNGSDPNFQVALKEHLAKINEKPYDYSETRYDDKYELKFSLRSLEKYAPWIRHVYIVTNGQIPYWLNLDYKKVTLVSHDEIFADKENLPTFSSPAIEAHIHRIPGLSKKFIYFNDDIFLGEYIYPEDFYSPNLGNLIYLVWPLPNCAPDCPWAYVGDEQCDRTCFNQDCQFDGGDCSSEIKRKKIHTHIDEYDGESEEIVKDNDYEYYELLQKKETSENFVKKINLTQEQINIKNIFVTNKTNKILNKIKEHNFTLTYLNNASNLIKMNDSSKKFNISEFVNKHNERIISDDHLKRRKNSRALRKHKKYFKQFLNKTESNKTHNGYDINNNKLRLFNFDSYAMSLQYTNRIFNKAYEFISRKVPAHSPIMIDKDIMLGLQNKFRKEFERTVRNKFRSSNDMQYSFSYYYYIISERVDISVEEIFDFFDTDSSQTLSDREIRTILTKLNQLPLTFNMVEGFDQVIINCSKNVDLKEVPTPLYERYIDSKLPTVSKELVLKCESLSKTLYERFGSKQKYKYEILKNAHGKYVYFKMLTSNVSTVVGHLDEIRKNPRKFVCINDDRDPRKIEENELVKAILIDFYISLFPTPSKFELPQEFRNRFTTIFELKEWRAYHTKLKYCLLIFILCLFIITFYNVCKKKIIRKIKRYIYLYF